VGFAELVPRNVIRGILNSLTIPLPDCGRGVARNAL